MGHAGRIRGRSGRVAAVAAVAFGCQAFVAWAEGDPVPGNPFAIAGLVTLPKDPRPWQGRGAKSPQGETQPIPIELDARFAVRVRVKTVILGQSPWAPGSEQVFLIHSPAEMFGLDELNGEPFRFDFNVCRPAAAEQSGRYCVTEVTPVERTSGGS